MIRLSAGGQPRIKTDESYPVSWQAFIGPNSESYYAGGFINGEAVSAFATVPTLKIRATPWVAPRIKSRATILTLSLTVGAAGNVRLGLYSSKGTTDIYPNALLVDSGNLSTAGAGQISYTIPTPVDLVPGRLYWVVSIFDASPTVNCFGLTRSVMSILGNPIAAAGTDSDGVAYELTVGALGALPNPFTAAATILQATSAGAGIAVVAVGVT